MITFILIDERKQIPGIGEVMKLPLMEPSNEALYAAKRAAIENITTEYFSLLGGKDDILFPNFDFVYKQMIQDLDESGLDIASAKERRDSNRIRSNLAYMHHGVICRTSATKQLNLPISGCIHFETAVYSLLSKKGSILKNIEIYNWVSLKDDTILRNSTPWAIRNGYRLLAGEEILSVPAEYQD